MKTREELKAAILENEYTVVDGVVDARCNWCGATGDIVDGDVKMEPHDPDCLWLKLRNETSEAAA